MSSPETLSASPMPYDSRSKRTTNYQQLKWKVYPPYKTPDVTGAWPTFLQISKVFHKKCSKLPSYYITSFWLPTNAIWHPIHPRAPTPLQWTAWSWEDTTTDQDITGLDNLFIFWLLLELFYRHNSTTREIPFSFTQPTGSCVGNGWNWRPSVQKAYPIMTKGICPLLKEKILTYSSPETSQSTLNFGSSGQLAIPVIKSNLEQAPYHWVMFSHLIYPSCSSQNT